MSFLCVSVRFSFCNFLFFFLFFFYSDNVKSYTSKARYKRATFVRAISLRPYVCLVIVNWENKERRTIVAISR